MKTTRVNEFVLNFRAPQSVFTGCSLPIKEERKRKMTRHCLNVMVVLCLGSTHWDQHVAHTKCALSKCTNFTFVQHVKHVTKVASFHVINAAGALIQGSP